MTEEQALQAIREALKAEAPWLLPGGKMFNAMCDVAERDGIEASIDVVSAGAFALALMSVMAAEPATEQGRRAAVATTAEMLIKMGDVAIKYSGAVKEVPA